MPAKAGIQSPTGLDARFRGHDGSSWGALLNPSLPREGEPRDCSIFHTFGAGGEGAAAPFENSTKSL